MEKEKIINALMTCYKLTMERRTGREVQIVVEGKDRKLPVGNCVYGLHVRRDDN